VAVTSTQQELHVADHAELRREPNPRAVDIDGLTERL
jgi:hypothetical protein